MTKITRYLFGVENAQTITTRTIDGQHWYMALDICNQLGIEYKLTHTCSEWESIGNHVLSLNQNSANDTLDIWWNDLAPANYTTRAVDVKFTLNASAVGKMLWSTEATFSYPEPALYVRSPYTSPVTGAFGGTEASNHTDAAYGFGFSTSNISVNYTDGRSVTSGSQPGTGTAIGTTVTCSASAPCTCTPTQPCSVRVRTCSVAAPCAADGSTLVTSPITAACIQCHDRPEVRAHMTGTGGGSFYLSRSAALAKPPEQCLICHGHGAIADISEVHMAK